MIDKILEKECDFPWTAEVNLFLEMKKLEIEDTEVTYLVSILKVVY